MPFYDYACLSCEEVFERMLPMSRSDEAQACPTCGKETRKVVCAPEIIFKGDDWASKNNRIAGQMRDKNKKLSTNQNQRKRDAPVATLAPNVGGERVGSWTEAQSLAGSQGKDTTSYAPKVAAEQALKK